MERNAILGAMPSNEEFQTASAPRQQQIVADLLRAVLDSLNREGREPDLWEALYIGKAIEFFRTDWYNAAVAAAVLAMAPSNERAKPENWGRTNDTATARALRYALEYAAASRGMNR
uniref:hypothetical protein n=1 Tax=Burkholderia diffusa TaxID=488732 RepID=UPI001CC61B79|nr:hypothetical protein [Burkholderia diffusa]